MRFDLRQAHLVRGGISASALALALLAAQPALAQSDVSTLQGHVDNAAAGTQVVATDRNTGQRVTATLDAGGNYRILGVRPSTYDVAVDGHGSQATTVLVGQTATVDFVEAPAGGTSADVVVRGSRSIVNVRSQSVTTNITPAQIENLPQNQRNFLTFASLAPGVAVSRGDNAQFSSGGTAAQNTNVLIDGLSLKNPINHGGVFGQNFGLGNPFPQSAIQEYKVDTQNFGAETGQVGAALITAVTKTGGNDFHGSAFVEFQPRQFIEQPYFDKKNNVPKPPYNRKQFGGELGGPIIKDKLVFYVAGEGLSQVRPAATALIPNGAVVPANVSSQILQSRDTTFNQGLYFGKLTFFATGSDTINAEAYVRRENNLGDIDANASLSHGRTILTHQNRYQLNWQHRGGDFLNNLNLAYDRAEQSTPSLGSGPEYILSTGTGTDRVALLGANSFNQGDVSKTYTVKDDATLSKGAHTIKAGAQVVILDLARTVNDHFNGTYYFANPGAVSSFDPTTATPTNYQINTAPTPTVAFKDTQIGFYLQDEWQPNDHWTINAGLRYDLETNANNNGYVTPAKIVTAIQNYQGWKAVGINASDYISTGNNRKPEYGAIQPRFGVSYDLNGDRDFVIFAGAGRYFDRSLFIEGVIETLTNSNNVVSGSFCQTATQTGCLNFTPALRDPNALRAAVAANGTGGSVFLLNNKTSLPFSDQFDIGIRKRFGAIRAELTYSHIRSHNIFQYVRANYFSNGWYTRILQKDANGNVTGCTNGGNAFIQDNIPNTNYAACPAMNGQLTGFQGKLDVGASNGTADYNAVYLKLEKPFTDLAKWGFTTALTLQFARSNDAQELNSDEFFNGTSQNVYGSNYVNGVEKYSMVTTAYWRAPFNIQLSGTATLTSGPSFGHIVFGSAADGGPIYGNFGGVYYPKPFIAYKRLDLRVAKTFKMPWDHGHEVTLDFQAFNVFNWLNRTYSTWSAGSGVNPPLVEDAQIASDARSFQAGIKYKF